MDKDRSYGFNSNYNFNKTSRQESLCCTGYNSCYSNNSHVKNINFIACLGHYSCAYSTFDGIGIIYAGGHVSLAGTTINSTGVNLTMYVLGYEAANNLDVVCNGEDTCTVYCIHEEVCGFDFDCDAQQKCNKQVIYLNSSYTTAYSGIPTTYPTANPTTASPTSGPIATSTESPVESPTTFPTTAPSIAPSIVPTIAPSIMPSIAPTIEPTIAPTIGPTIALQHLLQHLQLQHLFWPS